MNILKMTKKDYVFLVELTVDIIVAHIETVENAKTVVNTVVDKIKKTPGSSGFSEDKWRKQLTKELSRNFSDVEARKIGYNE